MKFTINQDKFSEILQQHLPVLPARTSLPILNSVKWDIKNQKLRMHSTDLEITLITECEVESDADGSVAVPARKISEIVRELPNEPISVFIEDNFRVKLQGYKGFYQVAGSDPEDFPAIPDEGIKERLEVKGEKLKRMIEHTSFAVSKDDMRPTLCGILLQILPEDMRSVSTDGHRLAKMVEISSNEESSRFEAIVPVKALQLAAKTMKDEEDIKIGLSNNYLMLGLNGDFLYSRLIEGKYPLYENVIPKSNSNILVVNIESFASTVRRVSIFSNSLTRQIKLAISKDKMIISAEDIETGGEAEEELSVEYQGEDMLIGFNANYVMEALRQIDTEEVKFMIGMPDSACIIEPTEQKED
jgi:DNA polymerase-3 subunit beta